MIAKYLTPVVFIQPVFSQWCLVMFLSKWDLYICPPVAFNQPIFSGNFWWCFYSANIVHNLAAKSTLRSISKGPTLNRKPGKRISELSVGSTANSIFYETCWRCNVHSGINLWVTFLPAHNRSASNYEEKCGRLLYHTKYLWSYVALLQDFDGT